MKAKRVLNVVGYRDSVPGPPFHGPTIPSTKHSYTTGIEEKSSLKTGTAHLPLKVSIGVAKIFQMHAIEL